MAAEVASIPTEVGSAFKVDSSSEVLKSSSTQSTKDQPHISQAVSVEASDSLSESIRSVIASHPAYIHYSNLEQLEVKPLTEIKPNLTGYTLAGDDKIGFRSSTMYFDKPDSAEQVDLQNKTIFSPLYSITFLHLGYKLSGHEGIVHGGLIATLLDELTCGVAFLNFESKRGVTANLNVNYRKPVHVNNFVVIKCEVTRKEGRKCWVRGSVYLLNIDDDSVVKPEHIEASENLLTESEVLIVEPRWVEKLVKKY